MQSMIKLSTKITVFTLAYAFSLSAADTPNLIGKWKAKCHEGTRKTYVEETYTFHSGARFEREQKRYNGKSCTADELEEIRTYDGTYSFPTTGEPLAAGAKPIDFVVQHVYDTAYGKEAIKRMNKNPKTCGIVDWKRGDQHDITGLFCNGEPISASTVVYEMVKRLGDKMYFGKFSFFQDASNSKNRPTEFDTVEFVKSGEIAE